MNVSITYNNSDISNVLAYYLFFVYNLASGYKYVLEPDYGKLTFGGIKYFMLYYTYNNICMHIY